MCSVIKSVASTLRFAFCRRLQGTRLLLLRGVRLHTSSGSSISPVFSFSVPFPFAPPANQRLFGARFTAFRPLSRDEMGVRPGKFRGRERRMPLSPPQRKTQFPPPVGCELRFWSLRSLRLVGFALPLLYRFHRGGRKRGRNAMCWSFLVLPNRAGCQIPCHENAQCN